MSEQNMLKTHLSDFLKEEISVFPAFSGKLITESGRIYYLKKGSTSSTYACEANGLKELMKADAIQIAKTVLHGDNFILTKYIESAYQAADFFSNFGRQFAQMHRYTHEHFGFYEDNFIGATAQLNLAEQSELTNWTDFYFNKRLLFQYRLAEKNSYVSANFKRDFLKLEKNIHKLLAHSNEPPALLHGDLWSGNFICNNRGEAVLIDPAVYYGHREADLAMTKVFGGFSADFYKAYQDEYPLQAGWEFREDVYKLYHLMNHLNIFGRGYLAETEWILKSYATI